MIFYKDYEITFKRYPLAPIEKIIRTGCNEAHVTLQYQFEDGKNKNQIEFISVKEIII